MMKIKFHGFLKKLCPKEYYEIDANTPAEAIRGLTNQMKQLIRIGGNRWVCRVKECPNKGDLYSTNPDLTELNLYPDYMPAGGGNGGTMQIIIGVVLVVVAVVAAFFTGGAALAAAGTAAAKITAGAAIAAGFAASALASSALLMGVGLILSGIATMMTKVPKASSDDTESNKYFGSSQNTTKIGTRIAIGYGKYKFHGHLLSVTTESSDK
jgi:predicted phage tail protein